jgi:hypothetical protein
MLGFMVNQVSPDGRTSARHGLKDQQGPARFFSQDFAGLRFRVSRAGRPANRPLHRAGRRQLT